MSNKDNSMFSGIDLSKATVTWPELDEEVFVVGDIVTDEIDKPNQRGTVIEVSEKKFQYKIRWLDGVEQEYGEIESVFLKKVAATKE